MSKKKYFTEEERQIAKKRKRKEYYQNHKEEEKKYYETHKEEILIRYKEYRKNHKIETKSYGKEYRKTHKKEKNEREIRLRKNNINYKISCYLRSRSGNAIKNNQKAGSFVRDLGCSIPELKLRLESMFQSGMTWDNWSRTGWHIDHIIPLDFFDLSNREEFLKAVHYTNLQPLWSKENLKKNNKILIKS